MQVEMINGVLHMRTGARVWVPVSNLTPRPNGSLALRCMGARTAPMRGCVARVPQPQACSLVKRIHTLGPARDAETWLAGWDECSRGAVA